MPLPELLDSTLVFEEVISVRKDRLIFRKEHVYDYFVVSSKAESVAIIALAPNGDILVTQEYRHPVKRVVFGCPGGLVNQGEDILEAGARELLEETGCIAKRLKMLGTVFPLPGILAQKMHIVLAMDTCKQTDTQMEITETIQSSFVSRKALDKILEGRDVDGVFCSALYHLQLHEQRSTSN